MPSDPLAIDLNNALAQPSLDAFWGTDDLGRDVFSRVLKGASTTIVVSILALASSLCIGIVLGGITGFFYQTWIDRVFNWFCALILSLPFLLIMASIMSILEANIINAYVILSCIIWVGPARIVRAEVMRIRNLEYIQASRAFGVPEWRILAFTIMPGAIEAAFTYSVGYFAEIVGLEAGLSFLGLGVQPPAPGLGNMIFDGLKLIYTAWWMPFFPALTLFVITLSINIFVAWARKSNRVA